jgi:two-component system sensor histidine kinase DesK
MALAVVLVLGFGQTWVSVFIFAGGALGVYLPARDAMRAIAVLALLVVPVGLIVGLPWGEIAGFGLLSGACGITMFCLMGVGFANRELNLAREELARLAVTEERLRFARDLHDLLGHSLSVIALKSELAGRLIAVAPDRAADELRDVEAVARKALHEVREAVAGYRQPTLDEELRGGREILAAAGMSLEIERDRIDLPAPVEAALAWVTREGVTNVIRHSRARHCLVAITARDGGVSIEITDDGDGATPDSTTGSGLVGIAERISALGGRFEAGPRPKGGFRLAAWVPLVDAGPDVVVPQIKPEAAVVLPTTELVGARSI